MIDMLAGALLLSCLIATVYFFQFWKRTGDRLFVHFAVAFSLFVLNQLATAIPNVSDETDGYQYLLRVLGFIVIIGGIIDKNRGGGRSSNRRTS